MLWRLGLKREIWNSGWRTGGGEEFRKRSNPRVVIVLSTIHSMTSCLFSLRKARTYKIDSLPTPTGISSTIMRSCTRHGLGKLPNKASMACGRSHLAVQNINRCWKSGCGH